MDGLLIGSRALAFHSPEFAKAMEARTYETDWDIISEHPIPGCDYHGMDFLNNAEFTRYVSGTVEFNGLTLGVVNLVGLAIIKRSHLWRDLAFDSHMATYLRHLKPSMALLTDDDRRVLTERTKLSYVAFKEKRISLKKTVDDFFDDYVPKKYVHDRIHELVAFHDRPLYTRIQPDPKFAWCDVNLWNALSYEDKLRCVAEETYVIAIERFLVPSDWKHYHKLAYLKALKKVCTTLTSGWFRDFAIDNYEEIVSLYSQDKVDEVRTALECVDAALECETPITKENEHEHE